MAWAAVVSHRGGQPAGRYATAGPGCTCRRDPDALAAALRELAVTRCGPRRSVQPAGAGVSRRKVAGTASPSGSPASTPSTPPGPPAGRPLPFRPAAPGSRGVMTVPTGPAGGSRCAR
ncbi:hypothetical protein HBB16_21215 [Pseudonocardia sp. MCCB 268]|nr:hypothetical protein [Pseudonocardia cytotoxica]